MNRAVIDQFVLAQEYPEKHTATLQSNASAIKFSATGDYLANGTLDGDVVVYDCDTWEPLQILKGHGGVIQTLSWSSCSRYLLSASRDWQCILWDFKDIENGPAATVDLGCPVWMASLHPHNHNVFVAALLNANPVLVTINEDTSTSKLTLPDGGNGKVQVALFSPTGDHVILGSSKGAIMIVTLEGELVYSTKISSSAIIDMCYTPGTDFLVCTSTDRAIRKVQLPNFTTSPDSWNLEISQKFIDLVEKHQWVASATSPSGELILGTGRGTNDVYMWEGNLGSLVKIFEGPKENLACIDFQPNRQCFATTGIDSGDIHIFTAEQPQNWSALATDFVELHANEIYTEREEEFDIVDEDENSKNLDLHKVDVWTIEKPIKHFVIPVNLE
ncbi:Set1 complex component swd1 [Wickerhamiella sorbophila]|uniref:Set1 complex component swd1 n=1 Tax=Wickerhamiella sorbophila TaxID=45607 RepID=A0A2T0FJP2_9ASCO|nr:Set1 complex component swd1 [Wickerhamiella sorbophila]PRT55213.1 Set1 complex component swd1 [Wickerhamiella sorbophila]